MRRAEVGRLPPVPNSDGLSRKENAEGMSAHIDMCT